jgi:hypothetical protein
MVNRNPCPASTARHTPYVPTDKDHVNAKSGSVEKLNEAFLSPSP